MYTVMLSTDCLDKNVVKTYNFTPNCSPDVYLTLFYIRICDFSFAFLNFFPCPTSPPFPESDILIDERCVDFRCKPEGYRLVVPLFPNKQGHFQNKYQMYDNVEKQASLLKLLTLIFW